MKPKVQVIARRAAEYGRENRSEGLKIQKNTAPELHPMAQQIEYVRAVKAAKMKKMFSKPFIGSLEKHSDTVYAICRNHKDIRTIVSGGADGNVCVWDLSKRECLRAVRTHAGTVNDVTCDPNSDLILSVGNDKIVHGFTETTSFSFPTKGALSSVDYCYNQQQFVTGGSELSVWSPTRNTPFLVFDKKLAQSVKDSVYNMNDPNLICACCQDRSIVIADTRQKEITRRITLAMQSNAVDWNPQVPNYFVAANDDTACYLFDIRMTGSAVRVFTDHLGPVTCVNFSPNGKEFLTGSYDRTLRIWDWNTIKSKDCYHTKRMQRVFACCVSPDSKFALSGSEDMSIRIFKTKANEELSLRSKKEENAQLMNERLLKKWRHAPEVSRIADKQNLPKSLHKQRYERAKMMDAASRKALNRMAHAADVEKAKPKPLREGRVVNDEA